MERTRRLDVAPRRTTRRTSDPVQAGDREHVFVPPVVVLEKALPPEAHVSGVDDGEVQLAPVDAARALHRSGAGPHLGPIVVGFLDGPAGLDGVGHGLENAAERPAAEDPALGGEGRGWATRRRGRTARRSRRPALRD